MQSYMLLLKQSFTALFVPGLQPAADPGSGFDFFVVKFIYDALYNNPVLYTVASMGSRLILLPVAEKIALATAGAMGGVPGSPMPLGFSVLGTIWTSTTGMLSILRTS